MLSSLHRLDCVHGRRFECSGTTTIKDTVNALRGAGDDRDAEVAGALDVLGDANLVDRAEAWR